MTKPPENYEQQYDRFLLELAKTASDIDIQSILYFLISINKFPSSELNTGSEIHGFIPFVDAIKNQFRGYIGKTPIEYTESEYKIPGDTGNYHLNPKNRKNYLPLFCATSSLSFELPNKFFKYLKDSIRTMKVDGEDRIYSPTRIHSMSINGSYTNFAACLIDKPNDYIDTDDFLKLIEELLITNDIEKLFEVCNQNGIYIFIHVGTKNPDGQLIGRQSNNNTSKLKQMFGPFLGILD